MTRCACCGRRLSDPESISIGMGSTCRGRRNWTGKIPAASDRTGELSGYPIMIGIPEIDREVQVLTAKRMYGEAAALLVKIASLHRHDPIAVQAAWGIVRLGYEILGWEVLHYVARIELAIEGDRIVVRVPPRSPFEFARKEVPGRSFPIPTELEGQCWSFVDTPDNRSRVVAILQRVFPQEAVLTPTRVFLPGGSSVARNGQFRPLSKGLSWSSETAGWEP
jgi:hypothetical protein